jgi:hypothetical protein
MAYHLIACHKNPMTNARTLPKPQNSHKRRPASPLAAVRADGSTLGRLTAEDAPAPAGDLFALILERLRPLAKCEAEQPAPPASPARAVAGGRR